MAKLYPISTAHNHDEVYAKIGESGVTDHGALTGLGDNDHPQYLLTSGVAANSDKLDGLDSTGFVQTSGNQTIGGVKTFSSLPTLPTGIPTANQPVRKGYADLAYLSILATAQNSDKLDGIDSTGFALVGHDHNADYLGISAKAADSDKLDGQDGAYYQQNINDVNAAELGYNRATDGAAYIDFHTITDKKDYDARIIASLGDSSVGGGTLTYNAAKHVFWGQVKSPTGDYLLTPTFTLTAPTVTASGGTFTTVSSYAKHLTIGKMMFYSGTVYIGNAGTATGTLRVTIPTGTAANMGGARWVGSGYASTSKTCFVTLLPTQNYLEILRYDGATAIAAPVSISFSIMYELA